MENNVKYLFRKLRLNSFENNKPKVQDIWYMVLRTPAEVFGYMNVDTSLSAQALMTLNRNSTISHLTAPRERVLHTMMNMKAYSIKEGEKVYPFDVLNELVVGKSKTMFNLLMRGEYINVNEAGGYCGHDGFIKTWNATVIAEVEKDSTYFPNDEDALKGYILYLENAERVDIPFRRTVEDMEGYKYGTPKDSHTITILKEKDPHWVAKSIAGHSVIAIKTAAIDDGQINDMLNLFNSLEDRKKVYLDMPSNEVAKLEKSKSWIKAIEKHEVIFV